MPVHIRLAEAGDYPSLADLHNSHNPFELTAEQLRRFDHRSESVDPHFRRAVAVAGGRLVAAGEIRARWADTVQPGRYWVAAQLADPAGCQGPGVQLVSWLAASIRADVRELAACIRSDYLSRMPWLLKLGFTERFVSWGAHLDLTTFDFAAHEAVPRRLEDAGYRFVAYPELELADKERQLRQLQEHINQDVLSFEPIVPSGRSSVLAPDYLPAGLIIALDPGGRFIGLSSLRQESVGGPLENGLTGVHRAYRGKGVATAVKIRSLEVARSLGATGIGTGGGGRDSPMKHLNRKLGFTTGPDWVTLISER